MLFTVLSIAALVAVALVGLATLSAVWRSGARDVDQPDGYPYARYGRVGPTWPPTA